MSDVIIEETFTEERVEDWCIDNVTDNDGETVFGEPTVPNMMLLDTLQAIAEEFAEDDETALVQSIVATRFRDPVLQGETARYEASLVAEDKRFTAVEFEIRVPGRNTLSANGTINLTIT